MNLLCIDYGTRRIGIALASTPLAEPLEIVPNSLKNATDIVSATALQRIMSLLDQHTIGKIVVGISEEGMATKTREFIGKLHTLTSIPIEEMDETLSTYEVKTYMKNMKKSKREGERDHFAAAQILQNYLDTHETEISPYT